MKFIIIIIIFSIGSATDIESAEPLSEVCSVYRQRYETFCHCSHCGVSLCAVRGRACFREFIVVLAFVLCVGGNASGNSLWC